MARGKGATLGFIGEGEIKQRATNAILSDQLEAADNNLRFIFPVTKDHFNEGIQIVADFARKHDIPYEVVLDDTSAKLRDAKEYIEDAVKEHKVARIPHKVVALLEKAGNGKLVVLWNDDEDDAAVAFARAYDAEIETFDLCSGFDKVKYDEDEKEPDDEEETEKEPEDDEEEETLKSGKKKDADVTLFAFTKKQLEAKDLDELKAISDARGIEYVPRQRQTTFVRNILDWQDENEPPMPPKGVDPMTGELPESSKDEEKEPEEDDEEETPRTRRTRRASRDDDEEPEDEDDVRIPEEDEDVEIPKGDDEDEGSFAPMLVGNCQGCGGPFFADVTKGYDGLRTTVWHAENCPLA